MHASVTLLENKVSASKQIVTPMPESNFVAACDALRPRIHTFHQQEGLCCVHAIVDVRLCAPHLRNSSVAHEVCVIAGKGHYAGHRRRVVAGGNYPRLVDPAVVVSHTAARKSKAPPLPCT